MVGKVSVIATSLGTLLMASQPCAAEPVPLAQVDQRTAGLAGLALRMPLGPAARPQPSLRLQLTADQPSRDRADPAAPDRRPRGIEIGWSRSGALAMFVNGQSAQDTQARLGLGGEGASTPLIIGGVLVAVAVVALAASGSGLGDTCPTVGGSRDHCIDP